MSDSHFVGGHTYLVKVGKHSAYYLKPLNKTAAGALKAARSVVKRIQEYQDAVGETRSNVYIRHARWGADHALHEIGSWKRVSVSKRIPRKRKRRTSRRRTSRR